MKNVLKWLLSLRLFFLHGTPPKVFINHIVYLISLQNIVLLSAIGWPRISICLSCLPQILVFLLMSLVVFVMSSLVFMQISLHLTANGYVCVMTRTKKIVNIYHLGSNCMMPTMHIILIINLLNSIFMTENWKNWLNAIISALVAFLTALGATSCAEFINL